MILFDCHLNLFSDKALHFEGSTSNIDHLLVMLFNRKAKGLFLIFQ